MFDIGQLLGPLIFNPYRFKDLWNLLEDDDAITVHHAKLVMTSFDEDGAQTHHPISDRIRSELRIAMKETRSHYANMMLVNAVTYLEDTILSFFKAAFEQKPQALNGYLKGDRKEAVIPLGAFLSQSKETILNEMVLTAARLASNGELSKVFKRVKQLSGYGIPECLTQECISLVEKRNRIVHEGAQLELQSSDVLKAFDSVTQVLKQLGYAARCSGVPVFDPAHLLD